MTDGYLVSIILRLRYYIIRIRKVETLMKRFGRIMIAALLAACMALATTGCASGKIAASVGDRNITVTELKNIYDSNQSYATIYGFDTTTPEGRREFLDLILDQQLSNAVQGYQAEKAGVQLTAEEKETAKTAADAEYDKFIQQFVDYAKQAGSTDPEVYAKKIMAESLAKSGTSLSKLKKEFLREQEDSIRISKYREQLLADATLTEDDLVKMYEDELELQKQELTENPSYYFVMEQYHVYGYTYMPLYVPEGFFYVRQILVDNEETANTILEQIGAGEDFEALLSQYNIDPGMATNPEGYVVGEGANFVTEFLDAALALENEGDVSPVVQSEHGYHIIKRMGNVPSGPIAYEDVKDEFNTMAVSNHESEYYNNLIQGWLKEDSVKRYPENYESIAE